jgi:hypothetical protein
LGIEQSFGKVWGSLTLLTYPYAMQCHVAILPDSLAFSFFLLLLAAGLKGKKTIYLFWFSSALFLPEYLYFGAVPVAVFWWVSSKKYGSFRKIGLELLTICVVTVMALGFHKIMDTEHDSLEEAWFRRTVWSSLYQFYPQWPEEVTDNITDEEYDAIRKLPENMSYILIPKVEKILGEEPAQKWFGEFGNFVFKANRQQIIMETVKDAGGYVLPNVFVELRLGGKGGSSYCNRNYEIMRQGHPVLTAYYIQYTGWWFAIGMFCATLAFLVRGITGCSEEGDEYYVKRNWRWFWGVGLVSGLLMVTWYTFQVSGLWNPKKALFVGCLWIFWMLREVVLCYEKEQLLKDTFEKRGEIF